METGDETGCEPSILFYSTRIHVAVTNLNLSDCGERAFSPQAYPL